MLYHPRPAKRSAQYWVLAVLILSCTISNAQNDDSSSTQHPVAPVTKDAIDQAEVRYLSWCAKMDRFDLCKADLATMKQRYGKEGIKHSVRTLGISFWCLNQSTETGLASCVTKQNESAKRIKSQYLSFRKIDAAKARVVMKHCSPIHVRDYTDFELRDMLLDQGIPFFNGPPMLNCMIEQWEKTRE